MDLTYFLDRYSEPWILTIGGLLVGILFVRLPSKAGSVFAPLPLISPAVSSVSGFRSG